MYALTSMSRKGNITSDVKTDSSCSDNASNEIHPTCMWDLGPELKDLVKDVPEVMEYIQKLQRIIKKHIKKISKLKEKLRTEKKVKHASVQTDDVSLSYVPESTQKNEAKSLADDIKEAAEIAMQNSGFVYEETSGMYYDYNTGYYYNAEYGLYYDGKTGTYMKYNPDSQSYEFHSQVSVPESNCDSNGLLANINKESKRKSKRGSREKENKRQRKEKDAQSQNRIVEEGECSETDTSEDDYESSNSDDISRKWPPCMRIIVESSDVAKMKVGSLHIITYDGGTLGREGDHSIIIPDINTSKHHLKFNFDKESSHYVVVDLGSRNGTLLNGKRMSSSKQESEPLKIVHGSKIQIGTTVLLCHIHEGNQTCGHCEPGLIQSTSNEFEERPEVLSKISRSQLYRKELKNLKKICGVDQYEEETKLGEGYEDRAQKRRETVGSQNHHEKTQTASLDQSISQENKGFKLLAKMGWKEGESLGKDGEGIKEPIKTLPNRGNAGIGCTITAPTTEEPVAGKSTHHTKNKNSILKKTQDRFKNLPETSDAFNLDSHI